MDTTLSIIVPCYNQAQYLDECLQSVFEQTFTRWECIVINDGSNDETYEVMKKWLKKDNRFKYISQDNQGVSAARNKGISDGKGEFILPLDADDKIGREYIKLVMQAFYENHLLQVVYCKAEKFGDNKEIWDLPPFSLSNLSKRNMIFNAAVFRKRDWERVEGYDVKMIQGLEDWEFWIAILKNGGQVFCIDYLGFYYRIRKGSRHNMLTSENTVQLYEYLSLKHADFFISHFGSFYKINNDFLFYRKQCNNRLKSKKFVLNLFCKTFFNFQPFAKHRIL